MTNDLVLALPEEVMVAPTMREKVLALEAHMKNLGLPHIDDICPVRHHFSPGVYAREMFIPKGTIIVGKIHKHVNLNIMSAGELSVLTENGIERVRAPFTIVSPPGTKRVAYAHEDTVWTTIHGTDITDVDEIEERFIAQTEEDYIAFCEQQKQLQEKRETLCLGAL